MTSVVERRASSALQTPPHSAEAEESVLGAVWLSSDAANVALERLDLVYVEMNVGDAVFFHGNLLHRSDQNSSDKPRWVLICCYNSASNDPYKDHHHPRYTPLEKVDDDAIKSVGEKRMATDRSGAFLTPDHDHSAKSLG